MTIRGLYARADVGERVLCHACHTAFLLRVAMGDATEPRPVLSPRHPVAFTMKATSHPALTPQEALASSRLYPPVLAPAGSQESLLLPRVPAYPAQPVTAKTGLSRRRSRVRVPSLP